MNVSVSVSGDQYLAATTWNQSLNYARQRAERIQHSNTKERRCLIVLIIARIVIVSDKLVIQIKRNPLLQLMEVTQLYPTNKNPNTDFHEISVPLSL